VHVEAQHFLDLTRVVAFATPQRDERSPAAEQQQGGHVRMSESKGKRAFLDLDINGNRAAYARACAFVEATDLRHGWSSKDIKDLGGSEMSRLQEAYESDYDWKDKGRIIMTLPKERVVIELYEKDCPVATKNFKALCTGEKGKSGKSGNKLHYKGVRFHRIVKGFVCQGGDISKQTGAGGESIYGLLANQSSSICESESSSVTWVCCVCLCPHVLVNDRGREEIQGRKERFKEKILGEGTHRNVQ